VIGGQAVAFRHDVFADGCLGGESI
jgi:hypothetical protein